MIVTEIILNNTYDVTNSILEKFEKNGNLKIPQGFDFNTIMAIDKKVVLKDLFIEYVNNEEIQSQRFILSNGKSLKKINIPNALDRTFYCFFINKISFDDHDKMVQIIDENRDKENIALVFNIENTSSTLKNYSQNFDYLLNISVNEKTFEMKYSKGTLGKIVGQLLNDEIFYCFNLTPYFVYKCIYDVFKIRCNIHYCVNNNMILRDQTSKNSIDLSSNIENIKMFLMLEKLCLQISSKIIFWSHSIYSVYMDYYKELLSTKQIKTNYYIEQSTNTKIMEKSDNVILLTSTQYPRYGGAATCAYELHKYFSVNGINSVMVFFDNNIESKKINIDPEEIGNVYHFKLNRITSRYSIIEDIKQFHINQHTVKKILDYCGGVQPKICLAFNYLAPIITKTLFPSSQIYFLITGSKVLSEMSKKIAVSDLYKNNEIIPDYMEQFAIAYSEKVLPNSGISKNIFEFIYPFSKHKFDITWDMHEIFEKEQNKVNIKGTITKNYDIVFICSRFDREIKNVNLVKSIYSHDKLKKYKKVCIGIDSQKYIKRSNDIIHLGFLQKEKIDNALMHTKIVIIPSFMESYSITNREAINNDCISVVSKNVGNAFNMHKFFLCESVYNVDEWVDKLVTILSNYNYFKNLAVKTTFETKVKTLPLIRELQENNFKNYMIKKVNILIVSVDLPYVGGSGTNSYNIIKTLKTNTNLNVYGLYFSSSKQKGSIDPEKIGDIHRYNMEDGEESLLNVLKKIPVIDVIFCKNYKTVQPLKIVYPNSKIIYSPSGLRSVTALFSTTEKFINDIMENDGDIVKRLRNDLLQDEEKEINILKNINSYDNKLESYAFLNCDIIIPNSLLTYNILKKLDVSHVNKKLHKYIPITNISLTTRATDGNFHSRKYSIAFVCHSWKRQCKNYKLMFNIIKQINNVEILIVGSNLDISFFRENKRVTYYDNLEHNALLSELKKVKTLVMCSFYDSNPNTVLEAVQCGCNIVTSKNVGGYEFIDASGIVENYNNIDSWMHCIHESFKGQTNYLGPGYEELSCNLVNVFEHAIHESKSMINENSCVGIYRIPNVMDSQFSLMDMPLDYKFYYEEETQKIEKIEEIQKSDIYYLCTLKLAEEKNSNEIHYIKDVDTTLSCNIFYNINKYNPIHSKRVYIWYLKSLYDVLYFKNAGIYFLRGTYHNTYRQLLANKLGKSVLYPATSVPYDKTSIALNPLLNVKKDVNKNIKPVLGYDIVLTNVDDNEYNIMYPNSMLLPFYKFASDSYYLTNSKTRYIDFIFVANSTQHTKNHHLFHSFINYLTKKIKNKELRKITVMFVGNIETVRSNYSIEDFGNYEKEIEFINKDNISSDELREFYNNAKINLLFSGRDAVPRVMFESSACGCFNIALDTLSDGKYFFRNSLLGKLIGDPTVDIEKRQSSSISYIPHDKLWKKIYEYYEKEYNHEKIANEFSKEYSLEKCISTISVNL